MCLRCDGYTAEEAMRSLDLTIRVHGWAVQGVRPGHPSQSWAYSIGLVDFGLPELVLTNVGLAAATRLINNVASRMVAGDDINTAAAASHCVTGDIHVSHIHGDLVADWINYYVGVRRDASRSAMFRQLKPNVRGLQASHGHRTDDLSQPVV